MNISKSKVFKFGLPIALIFVGTLFVFAKLYFPDKSSVIYKYKDKAAVDSADGLFVIFNPFRDKTPEIEAEKFLEVLKNGNCEQLQSNVNIDCERENQYSLKFWQIVDREEKGNHINLHFKAYYYGDENNYYKNIGVTLQKDSNRWKVTNYGLWY